MKIGFFDTLKDSTDFSFFSSFLFIGDIETALETMFVKYCDYVFLYLKFILGKIALSVFLDFIFMFINWGKTVFSNEFIEIVVYGEDLGLKSQISFFGEKCFSGHLFCFRYKILSSGVLFSLFWLSWKFRFYFCTPIFSFIHAESFAYSIQLSKYYFCNFSSEISESGLSFTYFLKFAFLFLI